MSGNRKKNERSIQQHSRIKIGEILIISLIVFLVLIGRIVWIMNVKGEDYAKRVLSNQISNDKVIPFKRGTIYDRNGVVLALSELYYRVVVDPQELLKKDDATINFNIEKIAEFFSMTTDEIAKQIYDKPDSRYVVLKKRESTDAVEAYRTYKSGLYNNTEERRRLYSVYFEPVYYRRYPNDSLASHVIGYANSYNEGQLGIEKYYDDILNGTDGIEYSYMDPELNAETTVKEAENGCSIISTIDARIQRSAERVVKNFNETYGAKQVGVIVMDPNNAQVLAMASNTEFNLNDSGNIACIVGQEEADRLKEANDNETIADIRNKMWRNFCTNDMYEPGSTFKTITVAAALEEDTTSPGRSYYCGGNTKIGGYTISCNNKFGHGNLSLAESLMKSCNCALISIAEELGSAGLYKYEQKFGFGKKTGIDLPGEAQGQLFAPEDLRQTELATSSFGSRFNVTMVQMAAAYSSIINGGKYYTPHVAKTILDDNGNPVEEVSADATRMTVSESTASFIRQALYKTVTDGTGSAAAVDGYLVAGKTGTLAKLPKDSKKYTVSFMGFAPADNPQVLVYVVLDEIQDEEKRDKSSVAAGMVSDILKETLPYLDVYPDGEIAYVTDLFELLPQNEEYDPSEDEGTIDVIDDGSATGNANERDAETKSKEADGN